MWQSALAARKNVLLHLETNAMRRSRTRDYIADIYHPCDILNEPFESEAETGMGCGAEPAEVEIPLKIFERYPCLSHPFFENPNPLFTLASADNLSNLWHKNIHSCDSLSILIQLHIKCLDILWVMSDDDRSFDNLISQIPLMFGLQVKALLNGKLKSLL